MASLLFIILSRILGARVNATAFSRTNFLFIRCTDHGEEEPKRHDLALENLQRAKDKWNEDRMKRLDFINKILLEQNKARGYINNANEAMLQYYRIFVKKIKSLPPELHLSGFYHLSEAQRNGELLFVVVGAEIATQALYKYLK